MDAQTLSPTAEQAHILDLAANSDANLMISALAGCGKTSTLEMIERAVHTRPILYLCFNKKIADDATTRMLSTTTVRTFNSLGHRIWAKSCSRNLTLDPRKSQTILREIINETPRSDQGPLWDSFWEIIHGVALAKALGYVPTGKYPQARRLIDATPFHSALDETPDDLTADLIDAVLTRSIAQAYQGRIDYNDQVYMPALFGGTFPRFPLVMVDEVQDLNPVNHQLLERLVKHRIIGVGDAAQSIYGFRGAAQQGMSLLQRQFSMDEVGLTVSFRCPQAIVENARWRAPNFKWIKEGGRVETLHKITPDLLQEGSTILCRNNAPLFKLGLGLLALGRSVQISGSDVGPKLIGILKKMGDPELPQSSLLSAIDDWLAEKLARESTTAQDLADCMKVFAGFGSTLGSAIAHAEHLFAQKGAIRLMTGHKAKGLEFETVYFLDPWLCRDSEQDLNLKYVIETRSLDSLFYINSRDIQW